jgi:hypothetical protein
MANELQNNEVLIIVGTDTFKLDKIVSDFKVANVLTYITEPTRTNEFTVQNKDIEAYYVPKVDFTYNFLTPAQHALFIQVCNSKGFFVKYYDYEIQTFVQRRMYATENSIQKIVNKGRDYDGTRGVQVTFVSIFGYKYAKPGDANFSLVNKLHYANVYLAATEIREST